jgi:MOSC domain-containing protein YiiM
MIVVRVFICPEHIYAGHFGGPAGLAPMAEVDRARVVAGKGIVGDRYFDHRTDYKGQVTFFSEEVWLRLQRELKRFDRGPDVLRRNLLVRGAELPSLIGEEFEVQGVRFAGAEHCKPCFWMDQAFGAKALSRLSAWIGGGLRARVLSDGWIASETAEANPMPVGA